MSRRLREDQHRARVHEHLELGRTLADVGHEWAAVPLFYAAYHVVKGALLRDPIFDDLTALHATHVDLIAEDRFCDRHKGRRRAGGGPIEWGINELVQLLYPSASRSYELLHQASILVRYGTGLPEGALPDLVEAAQHLLELDSNGDLQAALPS